MDQLPGAIKGLVILFVIIGVIVAIPVFFIAYWYVSIPVTALIIAGIVYAKRQKTAANRV